MAYAGVRLYVQHSHEAVERLVVDGLAVAMQPCEPEDAVAVLRFGQVGQPAWLVLSVEAKGALRLLVGHLAAQALQGAVPGALLLAMWSDREYAHIQRFDVAGSSALVVPAAARRFPNVPKMAVEGFADLVDGDQGATELDSALRWQGTDGAAGLLGVLRALGLTGSGMGADDSIRWSKQIPLGPHAHATEPLEVAAGPPEVRPLPDRLFVAGWVGGTERVDWQLVQHGVPPLQTLTLRVAGPAMDDGAMEITAVELHSPGDRIQRGRVDGDVVTFEVGSPPEVGGATWRDEPPGIPEELHQLRFDVRWLLSGEFTFDVIATSTNAFGTSVVVAPSVVRIAPRDEVPRRLLQLSQRRPRDAWDVLRPRSGAKEYASFVLAPSVLPSVLVDAVRAFVSLPQVVASRQPVQVSTYPQVKGLRSLSAQALDGNKARRLFDGIAGLDALTLWADVDAADSEVIDRDRGYAMEISLVRAGRRARGGPMLVCSIDPRRSSRLVADWRATVRRVGDELLHRGVLVQGSSGLTALDIRAGSPLPYERVVAVQPPDADGALVRLRQPDALVWLGESLAGRLSASDTVGPYRSRRVGRGVRLELAAPASVHDIQDALAPLISDERYSAGS